MNNMGHDMKRYAAVLACTLFCAVRPAAAAISLKPFITLSEEYNNNVHEDREKAVSSFITSLLPGANLLYEAPFGELNVGYHYTYRHYHTRSVDDESYHTVTARGAFRSRSDRFHLDFADNYRRIYLDPNRENLADSIYGSQTNQNFLTVSPYLKLHPRPALELEAGYQYRHAIYDHPATIDWHEHGIFLRGTHELTGRWLLTSDLALARTDTETDRYYTRITPTVGVRYSRAGDSYLSAGLGVSMLEDDRGSTSTTPYWRLGISQDLGPWDLFLDSGITYNTDPVRTFSEQRQTTLGMQRGIRRGTFGSRLYYREIIDNEDREFSSSSAGGRIDIAWELAPRVKAQGDLSLEKSLEIAPDRMYGHEGLPWHLSAGATLGYALAEELALSLYYRLTSYTGSPFAFGDGVLINRGIVSITKTFKGFLF